MFTVSPIVACITGFKDIKQLQFLIRNTNDKISCFPVTSCFQLEKDIIRYLLKRAAIFFLLN